MAGCSSLKTFECLARRSSLKTFACLAGRSGLKTLHVWPPGRSGLSGDQLDLPRTQSQLPSGRGSTSRPQDKTCSKRILSNSQDLRIQWTERRALEQGGDTYCWISCVICANSVRSCIATAEVADHTKEAGQPDRCTCWWGLTTNARSEGSKTKEPTCDQWIVTSSACSLICYEYTGFPPDLHQKVDGGTFTWLWLCYKQLFAVTNQSNRSEGLRDNNRCDNMWQLLDFKCDCEFCLWPVNQIPPKRNGGTLVKLSWAPTVQAGTEYLQ